MIAHLARYQPGIAGGHDQPACRSAEAGEIGDVHWCRHDEGVELTTGSGRWEPLGNPTQLTANFGSLRGFRTFLDDCKISAVSSWFFDPHQRVMEDLTPALSPLVAADRDGIVARATWFASPVPPRPPGTAARSMTPRWVAWPTAGLLSVGRPSNMVCGPRCTLISSPRCGNLPT